MSVWAEEHRAEEHRAEERRAEEPADPVADCAAQVAAQPSSYEAYLCLLRAGRDPSLAEAAKARLEGFGERWPESGWPPLVLGHLALSEQRTEAAFEHYRVAAELFAAVDEAKGEVLARANRHLILERWGRLAEAADEVAATRRAVAGSSDPEARARALALEGAHLLGSGGDLTAAHAALRRACDLAFESGPYGLRYTLLFQLARLAFHLGRHDEELATYDRLEALILAEGDEARWAPVAFNRVNARQAQLEQHPEEGGLDELQQSVETALAIARRTGNEVIQVRCRALLARIEATSDPRSAREHLAACKTGAAALGRPQLEAVCWQAVAAVEEHWDPAAALAATAEALAAADAVDSDLHRAHAWRARLRAAWAALPAADALAEGRRALRAIENLRDQQPDATARARVIGSWTSDYSWLAGRVLASGEDPAEAFAIFESLRSRVLLQMLSTAGLPEPVPLAEVQSRLRPSEALLTFQVDEWVDLFGAPAGGSWLLAITRDSVRVLRLPGRHRIAAQTTALRGLIARRDGSHVELAAELGRQLLGEALAGLPSTIERLILVPDDALHQLPFAVLATASATPPGTPLALRYELVVAPSATLWHGWRAAPAEGPERTPALVLADPAFLHGRGLAGRRGAGREAAAWVDGLRLGRLPQARREGRAIRRHLGGELWVGEEASERRLKGVDLSRYSLLHLAAHAVVDLRRPERSCLLLAPGHEDEDGLLRAPEVADLDLRGQVVVLSACQTSHGEILRGEGLMSLARAFFAAGAVAVVGSRWPLEDSEAADFFDAFYRQIAAGQNAAAALRSARRQGFEAGWPAEAWAGPVLLGSGDPKIKAPAPRLSVPVLTVIVLAVLFLVLATWRRWA